MMHEHSSPGAAFLLSKPLEQLMKSGLVKPDQLHGYRGADIVRLQSLWGRPLPQSFQEFLLVLGRGAGSLFAGTSILLEPEELLKLRPVAEELFESAGLRLPDNAFVFGVHQGYQVFYFLVEERVADPPVYLYTEGGDAPSQPRWPSFSMFLSDEVQRYIYLETAIGRPSPAKE